MAPVEEFDFDFDFKNILAEAETGYCKRPFDYIIVINKLVPVNNTLTIKTSCILDRISIIAIIIMASIIT